MLIIYATVITGLIGGSFFVFFEFVDKDIVGNYIAIPMNILMYISPL